MSTERAELPDEEEGRSWADRAAALAASVQSILSTRLAIFREEMGGKAALLGKGLAAIVIAAALGVGALLLFAALLAALLAKLFGSAVFGILGAMLIYAVGVAVAGRIAWQALTQVRPNEFPATERELARDWEAIKTSLAPDPEPEPEPEDDAAPSGTEPDPHEVENLEARLRGGTD